MLFSNLKIFYVIFWDGFVFEPQLVMLRGYSRLCTWELLFVVLGDYMGLEPGLALCGESTLPIILLPQLSFFNFEFGDITWF